jgi:hypothetical protein
MAGSILTPKETIDLLVQHYSLLRGEISILLTSYKGQVQYLQVIAAAAVGVVGFAIPSGLSENRGFWIALMFLMTTVVGYTVFTLLETLYSIIVLAGTTSVLESRINDLAREQLFTWESKLAPIFYSPKGLHPGGLFATYQWLLIGAGFFGLPAYYIFLFYSQGFCGFAVSWSLVTLNLLYGLGSLFFVFRTGRYVLGRERLWTLARDAARDAARRAD